ncbi:MAG: NAD-dependent deacetylase [Actinobacteria bacterium]|nr:NAD-dependent deacetylase [Actinomycetota bacterium]
MTQLLEKSIASARSVIDAAQRVVVLTGAGISTDSGIPDFRGPKGVWTRNPEAEKLSHIDHYLADPEVRIRAWQARLDNPLWGALPNRGHEAIRDLERRKKLMLLVTQNVDGLHVDSGIDPDRIVEVHGTVRDVVCMDCAMREPAGPTMDRIKAGERDPHCPMCGGILKSATISFGQNLVAEDLDRAFGAASMCDVLLTVGTELSVYPVAGMVPLAAESGAKIVIVNGSPTMMDELADVVVHGSISEVLPGICRR